MKSLDEILEEYFTDEKLYEADKTEYNKAGVDAYEKLIGL